jgi:hypothetical protein
MDFFIDLANMRITCIKIRVQPVHNSLNAIFVKTGISQPVCVHNLCLNMNHYNDYFVIIE